MDAAGCGVFLFGLSAFMWVLWQIGAWILEASEKLSGGKE